MRLEVLTGYEGANPQEAGHIEGLGESGLRVLPESEDGDSNYKFAFDITVRNPVDKPVPLDLEIDWQEPPEVGTRYMEDRESIFLHGGCSWREVKGRLDQDRVHFELEIPPGSARLCLHPPFGSAELEEFFKRAEGLPAARRISFGQSAEGRPLEAAVLPSLGKQQICLLAMGRLHPYETAGSHVVAGVLDLLTGPRGEQLRRGVACVLVPIANPDGAARGLCKRTTTRVNLSAEGNRSSDPTACALRGLMAGMASASARPALLDAHGWMIRQDGLHVYRVGLGRKISEALDGELFPNGWRVQELSGEHPDPATADLRRYADWFLGMRAAVTSSPWFGRDPQIMRKIGAAIAEAFLKALA